MLADAPAGRVRPTRGPAVLTPRAAAALEVPAYDFRRPSRISADRHRTLTAMHERLARELQAWLSGRVREQVEVRLQSVEQFAFGEVVLSLPVPCSSFLVDIAGSAQRGIIDIAPEVSTYVIDRAFGGDGSSQLLQRSLTPIERLAIRSVAERVAAQLQEMWRDHVPLTMQVTGFESSPEMLQQVMGRDDAALVANFEVVAGAASGLVLVSLPFPAFDTFFSHAPAQRHVAPPADPAERDAARQHSEASLRAARVPVQARLPEFQLTMRDLAQLTVGSVLPTGIPKDARVILRAGTQERFIGHPGRVGGHLAVRILDAVPTTPTAHDSRTPSA
jgi:flagellar motor switch protein FliM